MKVIADKDKLRMEVEVEGQKYCYRHPIKDVDELEYLATRADGLLATKHANGLLADEFIPVKVKISE